MPSDGCYIGSAEYREVLRTLAKMRVAVLEDNDQAAIMLIESLEDMLREASKVQKRANKS